MSLSMPPGSSSEKVYFKSVVCIPMGGCSTSVEPMTVILGVPGDAIGESMNTMVSRWARIYRETEE